MPPQNTQLPLPGCPQTLLHSPVSAGGRSIPDSGRKDKVYNPGSYPTVLAVADGRPETLSLRRILEEAVDFRFEIANRKYSTLLGKELEKKEALAPGKQAPDFTLNDPEGNPVKFSEVYPKNKVTMIDFWASWCGPCRKFNPTLTQIYAKYNKKGFGILGVSLDREQEKWVEAIKADKLVWQHVSDLKFWDSEAGRLYNISSIPQSYFVDSEGKILLASPSEDQIESFLAEYLK